MMIKEDHGYLVFPLKLADLDKYTQRRKKAYCKALGVRGAATGLMDRLATYVSGGRSGARRPETAAGGVPWSEWGYKV